MKEIFVRQERNGQRASGQSADTAKVEVNEDGTDGSIVAKAYLPTNFRGIGRKPGTMPPIKSIQEWIAMKRLNLNPWAVAMKIKNEGTLVFRDRRRGIDVQSIKEMYRAEFMKNIKQAIKERLKLKK